MEAFLKAIKNGNLDKINEYVLNGFNINQKIKGDTILYLAISAKKFEIAKYLIEKGADINANNKTGESILFLVLKFNNLDMIKYLVENGADINAKNKDDLSVLQISIIYKKFDIAKYLIQKGANIFVKDKEGNTVLHLAIQSKNLEITQLLVESGANINDKNIEGITPVSLAVITNNLDIIKFLITASADVNRLLHMAIKIERIGIVKYLIEYTNANINKNIDNVDALYLAVYKNNLDLVKYLIEKGAYIHINSPSRNTVLHLATRHKNIELVKYLIEKGIDINALDNSGNTSLHIAADIVDFGIIKLLMANGADITIKNKYGNTAFDIAESKHVQSKILDMLQINKSEIKNNNENVKLNIMNNSHILNIMKSNKDIPDFKDLIFLSELGGSTGAKLYKSQNGEKWIVKKSELGGGVEQIKNEITANQIYKFLNIPTPLCKLDTSSDSLILEYIDGKILQDTTKEEFEKAKKEISSAFVVDALLSNRDVIGSEEDNIIIPKDGSPAVRIDNGGALIFSGSGKKKKFDINVNDIDTMRNKNKNPIGYKIFGHLTTEDIHYQINKYIKPNIDLIINLTPINIRSIMIKRIENLLQYGKPAHEIFESNIKLLKNITNITDITSNTNIPHINKNDNIINDKNIKERIDERSKKDEKFTYFDRLIIEQYSINSAINEFLYKNKAISISSSEVVILIKNKFNTKSQLELNYYYFINLYNAIQKTNFYKTNKLLKVFRGVQNWYLKDSSDMFYYMNAFTSTTPALISAKKFTEDKIYVFYAHPNCIFMNINEISIHSNEKEILFAPYHRYIFLDERKSNNYTYKIFCIMPTDLIIPDTYDEFMLWKLDLSSKSRLFTRNNSNHNLNKEISGGRAESTLVSTFSDINRNTIRNIKYNKNLTMKKGKNISNKINNIEIIKSDKKWIESIPSFKGNEPNINEWKIIDRIKSIIDKDFRDMP